MSTYTIEANGTPMGEYTGDTATDALNTYARDAGYADYAAVVAEVGDDAIATEIDVDGLVAAVAAATGQAVFQDSYGSGVAVVAGKSFATYQELAESIGRNAWDTFEAPSTNAQLIRAYIDAEWADYKADDCTIDRIDSVEQIARRGYADVVQVGDYAIDTDDNSFREIVRIVDGRVVSVWTSF